MSSYADDLVLLSPTERGFRTRLNRCRISVSLGPDGQPPKTRVMMFQKRSRSQGPAHTFTLAHRNHRDHKHIHLPRPENNSTGNFTLAVNELKEKAQRAFYAIKDPLKLTPNPIWLKLFKAVIEPIALYGSEVWGPSIKFDFLNWEKHPIEHSTFRFL